MVVDGYLQRLPFLVGVDLQSVPLNLLTLDQFLQLHTESLAFGYGIFSLTFLPLEGFLQLGTLLLLTLHLLL